MKRKIILSLIGLLVFSLTLQYSKAQNFNELVQEEIESEDIASRLTEDVKGKRPSGGKQSKKSFWDRLKGSISNIIKDKNIDDIKNIDIDNIKSPDDVMDIFQKLGIDIDDLDIDIDEDLKDAIRKSNKKAKGDDDETSDPEDDIEVEMFIEKISKEQFKQILAMAKAGNPRAQLEVAKCYHAGNGVKQNFEKSAEWYYLATGQIVQLLLAQNQALSQMYNEYMQMMMHLGQMEQINPMGQSQGSITNPMSPANPMMGPTAPMGQGQINPASPIVPTSPMGPTSQINPMGQGQGGMTSPMSPASPIMGSAAPMGPGQMNLASLMGGGSIGRNLEEEMWNKNQQQIALNQQLLEYNDIALNKLKAESNMDIDMNTKRKIEEQKKWMDESNDRMYNSNVSMFGVQQANQMRMLGQQNNLFLKQQSERDVILWKLEQKQAEDDAVALNKLKAELTSLTNSGDYNNPRMDEVSREIHAIENRQNDRRLKWESAEKERQRQWEILKNKFAKDKEDTDKFLNRTKLWKINYFYGPTLTDPTAQELRDLRIDLESGYGR